MRGTKSEKEKKTTKKLLLFLGLLRDKVELKHRDSQKAHLRPLLNAHTYFQLPCSIWRGSYCEEQNTKVRKNDQKLVSLRLLRDEMGLKSRDPQRHI